MRPDLIAASFSVLRQNKQLILFPILSSIAALAVLAAFFGYGPVSILPGAPFYRFGPNAYPVLFAWYCVAAFSAIFFNCALAACAQECLAGGHPTVAFGLRRALDHAGAILVWAIISSTVGILLKFIERRVPFAGKIAVWLFGAAWGMASYLVVPVLIVENRNAGDSLRRSSRLLRETWGQQLTAGIRFGWRFLLFFVPGIVVGAIGMSGYPSLIAVAVVYIVALAMVMSAAIGIFKVALYRYAVGDSLPAAWSQDWMSSAFRPSHP
jgi:hypothetical protein